MSAKLRNGHLHYPIRQSNRVTLCSTIELWLNGRFGCRLTRKSTIASLLTRFYDINQGEILARWRGYPDYRLRAAPPVCPGVPNVHLFNDTANNIAYAATGRVQPSRSSRRPGSANADNPFKADARRLQTSDRRNVPIYPAVSASDLIARALRCVIVQSCCSMRPPRRWRIRAPHSGALEAWPKTEPLWSLLTVCSTIEQADEISS